MIYQVQDHAKPTRRQYLPLMELAHEEDPGDAQICFWLGRDYMWANQPEKGVELHAALSGVAVEHLGRGARGGHALPGDHAAGQEDGLAGQRARIEAPHRREIWLDLAEELHGQADWLNLFWACTNGIEKTHRTGSYLDDPHCWGFRLFDLGAIAAWHLNAMDRAVEWGQKALELDPGNQRLKEQSRFFHPAAGGDRRVIVPAPNCADRG